MSIPPPENAGEHFIPLSQKVLLDHLMSEDRLTGNDRLQFVEFYTILKSLFHFEFHTRHDELKETFHCFDPDPLTPPPPPAGDRTEALERFNAAFLSLMERANFIPLTREDLDAALTMHSPLAVNVDVDLTAYELLNLYSRGRSTRAETAPFMFFLKRKYDIEVYDRLVMLAKFAPERTRRRKKTLIGSEINHDKIYLKYFKNVPVPDIEMIFPDPRIKMSQFDKFKILVLILAPVVLAGGQLLALAGGDTSDTIVIGVSMVFGGYLIKTIRSFLTMKMKYIKQLTQGLYFKNLDNNTGVFDAVMGEAEEQEVKEAMLAYYFLRVMGPMDELTLDRVVEEWFRLKLSIVLDFEVDDALHKLHRLELASEGPDGKWEAIPLPDALRRIDYLWDNFFEYNVPEPG